MRIVLIGETMYEVGKYSGYYGLPTPEEGNVVWVSGNMGERFAKGVKRRRVNGEIVWVTEGGDVFRLGEEDLVGFLPGCERGRKMRGVLEWLNSCGWNGKSCDVGIWPLASEEVENV